MNTAGDATGKSPGMFFEQETIEAATGTLRRRIGPYGIPGALCRGKKNAFVLTREPAGAGLLDGTTEPESRFGKAREKPGIEVTAANSPRAKGRAERNHRARQDRLAGELRLVNISTAEKANGFLENTYLPKINRKFSLPHKERGDGHAPLMDIGLRKIFCFEFARPVSNGFAVRHDRRYYRILKDDKKSPRPGDRVTAGIYPDGAANIYRQEKKLLVGELEKQDRKDHISKAA